MLSLLRLKFAPGSELAAALIQTSDTFLLEHNERAGRDSTWSDDHDGSGTNWLGCQLMLVRDELRGTCQKPWTQFIVNSLDTDTGRPLQTASPWQQAVRAAAFAANQMF